VVRRSRGACGRGALGRDSFDLSAADPLVLCRRQHWRQLGDLPRREAMVAYLLLASQLAGSKVRASRHGRTEERLARPSAVLCTRQTSVTLKVGRSGLTRRHASPRTQPVKAGEQDAGEQRASSGTLGASWLGATHLHACFASAAPRLTPHAPMRARRRAGAKHARRLLHRRRGA
jgi:hypothetical protein